LLHSCWCIAFGCLNSNSKFEFNCLSPFQFVQIHFSLRPLIFPFLAQQQPAAAAQLAFPAQSVAPLDVDPAGPHCRRQPASPLPRPQPMTGGGHLSSPTRIVSRPDSRPSPTCARRARLPCLARTSRTVPRPI
jgi:hypothetical protein